MRCQIEVLIKILRANKSVFTWTKSLSLQNSIHVFLLLFSCEPSALENKKKCSRPSLAVIFATTCTAINWTVHDCLSELNPNLAPSDQVLSQLPRQIYKLTCTIIFEMKPHAKFWSKRIQITRKEKNYSEKL